MLHVTLNCGFEQTVKVSDESDKKTRKFKGKWNFEF